MDVTTGQFRLVFLTKAESTKTVKTYNNFRYPNCPLIEFLRRMTEVQKARKGAGGKNIAIATIGCFFLIYKLFALVLFLRFALQNFSAS